MDYHAERAKEPASESLNTYRYQGNIRAHQTELPAYSLDPDVHYRVKLFVELI